MKVSNILVAIDFSECSVAAFKYASEMAKVFSSRLILLNVVDTGQIERIAQFTSIPLDEIKQKVMHETRLALDEFISKWNETNIACVVEVAAGAPFHEIALHARKNKVDLIVVGGYGQRGKSGHIDEIFFGSTAEKIVRLLPCPVLCVPLDA